jgi:hypothetical protein
MVRRILSAVAVRGCLLPASARAATITFTSPDRVATEFWSNATHFGPLNLYEERGVRVFTDEIFGNYFACDPNTLSGGFNPITGPGPYGPISFWFNDGAKMTVNSFGGSALYGINLAVTDRNAFNQTECGASVIRGIANSLLIPLWLDGFQQVNFADYGFPNGVMGFAVTWDVTRVLPIGDPMVRVAAIDVPEPTTVFLFSVGLCQCVRRRRRPAA